MKLIISTRDFINENSRRVILNILPKNIEDCKILFIPNEKAAKESINSDKYYKRLYVDGFIIPQYDQTGYEPEIRNYVYKKVKKEGIYNVYTLTEDESLVVTDNEIIKYGREYNLDI